MAGRRLALAIYRGLLRFGRSAAGVPYELMTSDLQAMDPGVHAALGSLGSGGSGGLDQRDPVGQLARIAFRKNQDLQGGGAADALDSGLHALRLLNTDYAARLQQMREQRAERLDRSGLPNVLRVGQVVTHRRYGYRAVICGWDRTCNRGEEWAAAMGVDPNQPFFHVLPDEKDCVRLFGGARLSKYVACNNLEPVPEGRVVHRGLASFFRGYNYRLGRYVPQPKVQWCYPADNEEVLTTPEGHEEEIADIAADTNLLLHEEEEPPEQPAFHSMGSQA